MQTLASIRGQEYLSLCCHLALRNNTFTFPQSQEEIARRNLPQDSITSQINPLHTLAHYSFDTFPYQSVS
jgi:hypothetical protein